MAYVYKAKREIQGSKIRVIWGCVVSDSSSVVSLIPLSSRVTRPHGSSGIVKSKFTSNLPPRAFGAGVRIVRFTSSPLTWRLNTLQTPLDALPLEHLNCSSSLPQRSLPVFLYYLRMVSTHPITMPIRMKLYAYTYIQSSKSSKTPRKRLVSWSDLSIQECLS